MASELTLMVLERTREALASSPHLAVGAYRRESMEGTCFCLVGAIDEALVKLRNQGVLDDSVDGWFSAAKDNPMTFIGEAIKAREPNNFKLHHGSDLVSEGLLIRYNDEVLAARYGVTKTAALEAVKLIDEAIERAKAEEAEADG